MPSGHQPETLIDPVLSPEGLNLFAAINKAAASARVFPYGVDPVLVPIP